MPCCRASCSRAKISRLRGGWAPWRTSPTRTKGHAPGQEQKMLRSRKRQQIPPSRDARRLARSFAGSGRRSARADCKRSAERCASARSDEARLLVMQTLIWWTVASLMGCMDAWRCWHVNGLPCAGCVRCRCTARGPEESSIDLQEGACSAGDILWVFPLSGTSPGRWSSFPCVRCWKK